MKSRNLILSIIMAVSAVTAHAFDFTIGRLGYSIISLPGLTVSVGLARYNASDPELNYTDIVIPDSVLYAGRYFKVIEIRSYGFGSDSPFESSYESTVTSIKLPETLISISEGGFYRCASIESITIPSSVGYIGKKAFSKCTKLKHVNIPSSLVELEENLFENTNLESLFIPKNIVQIKKEQCLPASVSDLTIEDSEDVLKVWVKESPNSAGRPVNNLYYGRNMVCHNYVQQYHQKIFKVKNKFVIGELVTNVQDVDFNDVDTIVSYANYPPSTLSVSNSTYMFTQVLVPKGCLDAYRKTNWGYFWNIQEMDDDKFEKPTCDIPSIQFSDGKLKITTSTSGATCFYSISDTDVVNNAPVSGDINLTATYNITAYATADGYEKSETATATLCYIDGTFNTDGIETPQTAKRAVVISSNGGILTISGVEPGEEVSLYSISGSKISSVKASSSTVSLAGKNLQSNVGIIKIGNESIKVQVK